MPDKENAAAMSPHEQLLKRASERYPDRRFAGQTDQNGQNGQDDLEQAIIDMLSESDASIAENNDKNAKLVELFTGDPKCGEFVTRWVETGDPRAALVEVFGDELGDLSTEEGRGQFSESLKSWRSKKEENSKRDKEAEANWDKTLKDLEEWGNAKGLDDEKKAQVIGRLMSVAANAVMNIYTPADFDMVVKEMNYDNDVAAARQEGEVAGRNAKIAEKRRERAAQGAMPPALSGQGIRSKEAKPAVEKPESPWEGIE